MTTKTFNHSPRVDAFMARHEAKVAAYAERKAFADAENAKKAAAYAAAHSIADADARTIRNRHPV